jgi:hypothetical protein
MPPSWRTTSSTVAARAFSDFTSQAIAIARPPRFSICLQVSSHFEAVRPVTATAAPSAASAKAIPCPTPCPAPVTSATFPSSMPILLSFRGPAPRLHVFPIGRPL